MTPRHSWTVGLGGLALLLALAGCAAGPATGASPYRAVGVQPGDSVTVGGTASHVEIDVTSERGIGKVGIERTGRPPQALTVNLHLKGLEELRWSWGETTVLVHVASGDGSVREELVQGSAAPAAIDEASPYWAAVQIKGQDRSIPLADGFFAVTAPPAFLQAAPSRFTLQWIDFYR